MSARGAYKPAIPETTLAAGTARTLEGDRLAHLDD